MKVVTFGELMVRLQPFNYERFVQANSLEFTFGGGVFAVWKKPVASIRLLPQNSLAKCRKFHKRKPHRSIPVRLMV